MAEPPRRSLRSTTKSIPHIPLPERRAAPKKKVQPPQDEINTQLGSEMKAKQTSKQKATKSKKNVPDSNVGTPDPATSTLPPLPLESLPARAPTQNKTSPEDRSPTGNNGESLPQAQLRSLSLSTPFVAPAHNRDGRSSSEEGSTQSGGVPASPAVPENIQGEPSLVDKRHTKNTGEFRPRPVKAYSMRRPVGDPDELFLSARRGWRRSPPLVIPKTTHDKRTADDQVAAGEDADDNETVLDVNEEGVDKNINEGSNQETGGDEETASKARNNPGDSLDDETMPIDGTQSSHAIPAESPGSDGSDYEADAAAKISARERYRRIHGRSPSPTIEQQDEEDEREFYEEVQSSRGSGPKQNSNAPLSDKETDQPQPQSKPKAVRAKGKSRATNPIPEGDANPNHDNTDSEEASAHKSGPISDLAKEAAFALHLDYQRQMQALANEHNKPVRLFYQIVGQDAVMPRSLNAWNAYQAWYGINGEYDRPEDVSQADWTRFVREQYTEYLREELGDDWEDKERRAECMEPILEWYKGHLANFVENAKTKDEFKGVMTRVTRQFVQMSTSVYEQYGVHVFGFAIDPSRDSCAGSHSTSWGGSPEYVTLRTKHKHVIKEQISDYDAMFRIEAMVQQGLDVSDDMFPINEDIKGSETSRDRDRRVFAEYLRRDLGKILLSEGTLARSSTECSKLRIPWVEWANYAYEKRVSLHNWPSSVKAPGPGFELKRHINSAIIQKNKERRHAALEDPEINNYVTVLPWSDDDKELSLIEMASVPLIVNDDNHVVMSVLESTKYKREIAHTEKPSKSRKRKHVANEIDNPAPSRDGQSPDQHPRDQVQRQRSAATSSRCGPHSPHRQASRPPNSPPREDSYPPEERDDEYWDNWAADHGFPQGSRKTHPVPRGRSVRSRSVDQQMFNHHTLGPLNEDDEHTNNGQPARTERPAAHGHRTQLHLPSQDQYEHYDNRDHDRLQPSIRPMQGRAINDSHSRIPEGHVSKKRKIHEAAESPLRPVAPMPNRRNAASNTQQGIPRPPRQERNAMAGPSRPAVYYNHGDDRRGSRRAYEDYDYNY